MKYAAIIAAGGIGKRFGDPSGKQLFEYNGKPIIVYTIEKFIGNVDQIIIVMQEDQIGLLKEQLVKYNIKVDQIVSGGKERYDSVQNGLVSVADDIDYVMIHDGARPNVSKRLVDNLKQSLERNDAVIPVVPVVDTIKVIKDCVVTDTPNRSELYKVQTPQCFKKELINKAYTEVDLSDCTDDAMVVERFGYDVYTVDGDLDNIKITTREDLKYIK